MSLIRGRKRNSLVIEPLVNIEELEKEIVLEAEMPGLTKDDIALELKDNTLTIKGKGKDAEDMTAKGYTLIHRERCPLEYQRSFVLSEDIDKNKIYAEYINGILKVRLVKSEDAQPKKIDVS